MELVLLVVLEDLRESDQEATAPSPLHATEEQEEQGGQAGDGGGQAVGMGRSMGDHVATTVATTAHGGQVPPPLHQPATN